LDIKSVAFQARELAPKEWVQQVSGEPLVFNPTVLAVGDNKIAMCYRVSTSEGEFRRLATCLLDEQLRIIPDTVYPLSDAIRFHPKLVGQHGESSRCLIWLADPRYHAINGEIYLSWNDGSNKPSNNQYLVRMSDDGLRPTGHSKTLRIIDAARRDIEKNWMLFGDGSNAFAIYSFEPRIIFHVDLDSDEEFVDCRLAVFQAWSSEYSQIFGEVRGGASPILVNHSNSRQFFLSIDHSSYKLKNGRQYECCAHMFSASMPFAVEKYTKIPLPLREFHRHAEFNHKPLNPEVSSVVYPCGAVLRGDTLLVSYGINDESASIAEFKLSEIIEAIDTYFSPSPDTPRPRIWGITKDSTEKSINTLNFEPDVPIFWWNCQGKATTLPGKINWEVGNFGDLASKLVVELVGSIKTQHVSPSHKGKLLSIGSILHTAMSGDIVWGAGMKGTARKIQANPTLLDVRAVRGPLTLNFLRETGVDTTNITHLFDPGCLLAHLLSESEISSSSVNEDRGPIRIVPHYRDDLHLRRANPSFLKSFISVDCDPYYMICSMIGAEAVFSSSLHGIIFAESMGIPAYWIRSPGGEDSFKFYDYYYGTSRFEVKCFESVDEALSATPMPLPRFQFEKYLTTFPKTELRELGMRNINFSLCATSRNNDWTNLCVDKIVKKALVFDHGSLRVGRNGTWLADSCVSIAVCIQATKLPLLLEIEISPFNHPKLPSPQWALFRWSCSSFKVSWIQGNSSRQLVQIPIAASDMCDNLFYFNASVKHAVSPFELGVGEFTEKLTIQLHRIRIVSKTCMDIGTL
jgi:hypothetical protein